MKDSNIFKSEAMAKSKKTKLQIEFESQTPTIKGIRGNEYNIVYCAWLEFQVKKLRKQLNK